MIGTPKQLIAYLVTLEDNKQYEVKEYRKRRNKDQNAKYWCLVNKLALKLQLSVEEVHYSLLRDYSQRYEIMLPHEQELRGVAYKERKSTIKKNGKLFDIYWVFTPSHELNTYEFTLLLKGAIEECRQLGIETLSPDELTELEAIVNGGVHKTTSSF